MRSWAEISRRILDSQDREPAFPPPERVRSILDLQRYKTSVSRNTPNGIRLELINLNPKVGAWYVLRIALPGQTPATQLHLEIPPEDGSRPTLELDDSGLVIRDAKTRQTRSCRLWDGVSAEATTSDELKIPSPSVPQTLHCEGRVQIRRATKGYEPFFTGKIPTLLRQANLEFVVDAAKWLKCLWPGQSLELDAEKGAGGASAGPSPAKVSAEAVDQSLPYNELQLSVQLRDRPASLSPGRWYPVESTPGIAVSFLPPNAIARDLAESHPDRFDALPPQEKPPAYLTSFDLDRYEVGYVVGTDQPNPGWAKGLPELPGNEAAKRLPGPDGIGTAAPLVGTGIVPPHERAETVSTFNAGYQRHHMAQDRGPLSTRNHFSHWGYVQNGVVFSRLRPGLATAVTYLDGSFDLLTWPENDSDLLAKVKDARQNGVAVIEGRDGDRSRPGPHIGGEGYDQTRWVAPQGMLTEMSGICIQENGGKRRLLFAYLPKATVSTLGRVFQAYDCAYALQLDINLNRAGHLPLYKHDELGNITGAEHVYSWSAEGESEGEAFVTAPEYRDFFSVKRKRPARP